MKFFILVSLVLSSLFSFSQTLRGTVKHTANILSKANDSSGVIIQVNPGDDFVISDVSDSNFVKVSYRKKASTYTGYINKKNVNADEAYENHLKVLKAKQDLKDEKDRFSTQKKVEKDWDGFVKDKKEGSSKK